MPRKGTKGEGLKELLEQIKALTAQMKEVATDKGTTEAERDAKLDKMSEDLKALQDAIDKQPVGRRFEGNLDDAGFNSRDKGISKEVSKRYDECYTLARILQVNPTSTNTISSFLVRAGNWQRPWTPTPPEAAATGRGPGIPASLYSASCSSLR
jgi:hypothetical protein